MQLWQAMDSFTDPAPDWDDSGSDARRPIAVVPMSPGGPTSSPGELMSAEGSPHAPLRLVEHAAVSEPLPSGDERFPLPPQPDPDPQGPEELSEESPGSAGPSPWSWDTLRRAWGRLEYVQPYAPPAAGWGELSRARRCGLGYADPTLQRHFRVFLVRSLQCSVAVAALVAALVVIAALGTMSLRPAAAALRWVFGAALLALGCADALLHLLAAPSFAVATARLWLGTGAAAATVALTSWYVYQALGHCDEAMGTLRAGTAEECVRMVDCYSLVTLSTLIAVLCPDPLHCAVLTAAHLVLLFAVGRSAVDVGRTEPLRELLAFKLPLYLCVAAAALGLQALRSRVAMAAFDSAVGLALGATEAARSAAELDVLLSTLVPPAVLPRLLDATGQLGPGPAAPLADVAAAAAAAPNPAAFFARHFVIDAAERASVLFADMEGFTAWSARRGPEQVTAMLNTVVAAVDRLTLLEPGVEKIKTVGDAYWAVAGLPVPVAHGADRLVRFGLRMGPAVEAAVAGHRWGRPRWRVGVHTGRLRGAILGTQQVSYEVFGDTCDVAQAAERGSAAGRVCLTAETRAALELLPTDERACQPHGTASVNGARHELYLYADSVAHAAHALSPPGVGHALSILSVAPVSSAPDGSIMLEAGRSLLLGPAQDHPWSPREMSSVGDAKRASTSSRFSEHSHGSVRSAHRAHPAHPAHSGRSDAAPGADLRQFIRARTRLHSKAASHAHSGSRAAVPPEEPRSAMGLLSFSADEQPSPSTPSHRRSFATNAVLSVTDDASGAADDLAQLLAGASHCQPRGAASFVGQAHGPTAQDRQAGASATSTPDLAETASVGPPVNASFDTAVGLGSWRSSERTTAARVRVQGSTAPTGAAVEPTVAVPSMPSLEATTAKSSTGPGSLVQDRSAAPSFGADASHTLHRTPSASAHRDQPDTGDGGEEGQGLAAGHGQEAAAMLSDRRYPRLPFLLFFADDALEHAYKVSAAAAAAPATLVASTAAAAVVVVTALSFWTQAGALHSHLCAPPAASFAALSVAAVLVAASVVLTALVNVEGAPPDAPPIAHDEAMANPLTPWARASSLGAPQPRTPHGRRLGALMLQWLLVGALALLLGAAALVVISLGLMTHDDGCVAALDPAFLAFALLPLTAGWAGPVSWPLLLTANVACVAAPCLVFTLLRSPTPLHNAVLLAVAALVHLLVIAGAEVTLRRRFVEDRLAQRYAADLAAQHRDRAAVLSAIVPAHVIPALQSWFTRGLDPLRAVATRYDSLVVVFVRLQPPAFLASSGQADVEAWTNVTVDGVWLPWAHALVDERLQQCAASLLCKIKTVGDVVMLAGPFTAPASFSPPTLSTASPPPLSPSEPCSARSDFASAAVAQLPSFHGPSSCRSPDRSESVLLSTDAAAVQGAAQVAVATVRSLAAVLPVKAGLHVGPVLGTVQGATRLSFDVFGDAVNVASRCMTSAVGPAVATSDFVELHRRARTAQRSASLGARSVWGPECTFAAKGKGDIRAHVLDCDP